MSYTIENAKQDLKDGWIDRFSLCRWEGGWLIELWKGPLNEVGERPGYSKTLSTFRGQTRICKTLDAAVKVVEEIGFSSHYLTNE